MPPLSSPTVRSETAERFSCRNVQIHTHTHATYTRAHTSAALAHKNPRVIRLGSCILSSACHRLLLDSFRFSYFPHAFSRHQPRGDKDHNHGGMELNKTKQKPKPPSTRGRRFFRALSVNQNPPAPAHKDIYPLTPTGKS